MGESLVRMTNRNNMAGLLIDASTRSSTSSTRRRDVFILGAGFSKAICMQMPTMVELGAEVRKRLAEVPSFSSAIPDSLGDNIELWMTCVYRKVDSAGNWGRLA